jgi:tetratricopeptide (TPR) repeat protein
VADSPRIEELRRRVLRDPASIAFAQLAEEHRRAGDYEETIRVCRMGLAQHPGYLSARVTLGRALIEIGRLEEAAHELEQVLRTAPDNLAATRALEDIHHSLEPIARHGRPWETAAFESAPDSVTAASHVAGETRGRHTERALFELESWLSAIVAARARRHRGESPA